MFTRQSFVLAFGFMILSGCATFNQLNTEQFRDENRERLTQLRPGMQKDEVLATMQTQGTQRCIEITAGICTQLEEIRNPYRRSTHSYQGHQYDVYEYYTDAEKRELPHYYRGTPTKKEKPITEKNLTPVVFEKGKLIGWGRNFLDKLTETTPQKVME